MLVERYGEYLISIIKCCFNPVSMVDVHIQIQYPQSVLYHFGNSHGRIIQITEPRGPAFHGVMQAAADIKGDFPIFLPDLANAFESRTGDQQGPIV